MKRTLCVMLAVGLLLVPVTMTARAGEPDAVFQAVPGDAWGMVAVRSLTGLDKKIMMLNQATNSPMAGASMLMLAKGMLGLMSGIDDNGGVALVVMPFESLEQIEQKIALLIPVTNYTELLGWMQPEDIGNGVSKILFQGEESYVAQKGSFAVMGPSTEGVQAVMNGQGSFTANLTEHQLKRLATDDLTIWVDAAAVVESPMVAGLLAMGQAMGFQTEWATDLKTLQISLRFDSDGIDLGFYTDVKPGSDSAKMYQAFKPAAQSLLAGLPAESYVLAGGAVISAEAMDMVVQVMDKGMAAGLAKVPPEAAEMATKMAETSKKLMAPLRSLGIAANALPEGPDGLVGVSFLLGMDEGSAGYLALIGELIETFKPMAPEEETAKLQAVVYKTNAGGENVHHLVIDAAALGASEEDLGKVAKLLGSDGLTIRFAAVDDQHVAVTVGGGSAYLKTVSALVAGKQAPLADDAGIKKVAQTMPQARALEAFISPSGAMKLASSIAKVLDEELPFKLGPAETPIGVYSQYLPGGASQNDVLIPMELIKAVAQAAMSSMGGGPGGSGGSPPM